MRASGKSITKAVLVCLWSICCFAGAGYGENAFAKAKASPEYIPLTFEKNVGQTDSHVRFLSRSGNYRVYLTGNASVLEVAGKSSSKNKYDAVLRTTLAGSRSATQVEGIELQSSTSNYLVGPPQSWKTRVPNYKEIKYEGVYPGVDLKYYGRGHQLEYDFDVAPNSNPASIVLNIEGSSKITTSANGSLVLETAAGEVRWAKPVAYQERAGDRKLVSASYQVRGNLVSFKLGKYDRSKQLVIDPVLEYGTYLDGTNFERGTNMLVDSAGYVYVIGWTNSTDFPTTPGAYQRQIVTAAESQLYVTKLTQDLSALVWSTIIGGSGNNNYVLPQGATLDQYGNVYVIGTTTDQSLNSSTNQLVDYPSTFPTTPGAYNSSRPAAARYFLLKLNNTGSSLLYSTFLSDQPNINPYSVAVDALGDAYVIRSSRSLILRLQEIVR